MGAKALGFDAQIIHQQDIKDLIFPSILFVDAPLGREKHALVIANKHEHHYEIWDPDKGRVYWTHDYLQSRWHGNGISIIPKQL
jgi:ABC-type bacteriocin/lantibiotic exporter with double-glycine peptidase domain